jgi:hypothetical protein
MSLFDRFSKSVSNVINDEIDGVTSKINDKLENTVNNLFKKALKGVGIGGKLGRALEAEFASSLQNARADKFFGTMSSMSERAAVVDICNSMTPKFAETAFTASERLKGHQNEGVESSNVYQFPQQLMAYYTKLEFKQYYRPAPQSLPETITKHTVILPLPKDLEESLGVRLSQDDAGMAQGITNALFNITGGTSSAADETSALIVQAAARKLNDLTKGQANQIAGAIPNPYVTLMFNGVDLRSFTFTWKFAPRNETESKMLKNILQLIKGSALPTFSGQNTGVLQYPMLCKMTLMSFDESWGGTEIGKEGSHPIIGFKHALIENVTINYSPNGIPSFFAGTSLPTFYQVSMTLKEIEYFTGEDYGREPGTDRYDELLKPVADYILGTEIVQGVTSMVDSFFTKSTPEPKE